MYERERDVVMHISLCPRDENYTYISITSEYIFASRPHHEPNVARLLSLGPSSACVACLYFRGLNPGSHFCGCFQCSDLFYQLCRKSQATQGRAAIAIYIPLSARTHSTSGSVHKGSHLEALCLYLTLQETRIPGILIAR